MTGRRAVTVLTHGRPHQVEPVLHRLIGAARTSGVTLRFDPAETRKFDLQGAGDGVVAADAELLRDVGLCVVLGGDGTILKGLRCYAGTGVPVFAVNFGEVGFLATLEPEELDGFGFERAFAGEFEVLPLPAIGFRNGAGREHTAINDISFHRKVGGRVAQLSYGVQGEEVGSVRCDGLVVCTPAGSTGYNLANGGPVLAWGVEGFGVSFIAPHSLTARALVVAPADTLTVSNHGREAVDVSVDGRPACEVGPGEDLHAGFRPAATGLAQLPGSSFYKRLRAKFGRLSS
ncbi:MAG TPA: NAD(+)/NADH kinase [Solirubrobacteraceae bacterium]|nr:NAD(+)/NADH kinase [Solirubrobacteraceae bacterium]